MNIAIIPARGGSKRIPRKNIKHFCGKPMIAWSIEAAKSSGVFQHIIVSTDDAEIAAIAKQYGAEVPFVRPDTLADDFTGTGAVVKHATEWVAKHLGHPTYICTLYATAPFVQAADLAKSLQLLKRSSKQIIFSVTSYAFPIQRAVKILADDSVTMFQPEYYSSRSQDLEPAFHDAGQFYWSSFTAVQQQISAFSSDALAYKLPRMQVQDIDTEEDWDRAEWLFKALKRDAASGERLL
ncbi:pseudaminic acid cytidylyltransferase [Alishewanella sp. SMS8]|uniref:pseudaminic acid cytidylyltransferase n=1 Tax=Alishewanella sp. SMS8 TaxID=2994676 RepID=UPI0027412067|nr:pseudaminic acid cytidylyltransferase [Alishewanella sp. SMS8]MDP5459940.1 pseudaminic acid cytidylyltransferase [Alishewanella sp. SMS8]